MLTAEVTARKSTYHGIFWQRLSTPTGPPEYMVLDSQAYEVDPTLFKCIHDDFECLASTFSPSFLSIDHPEFLIC